MFLLLKQRYIFIVFVRLDQPVQSWTRASPSADCFYSNRSDTLTLPISDWLFYFRRRGFLRLHFYTSDMSWVHSIVFNFTLCLYFNLELVLWMSTSNSSCSEPRISDLISILAMKMKCIHDYDPEAFVRLVNAPARVTEGLWRFTKAEAQTLIFVSVNE